MLSAATPELIPDSEDLKVFRALVLQLVAIRETHSVSDAAIERWFRKIDPRLMKSDVQPIGQPARHGRQ